MVYISIFYFKVLTNNIFYYTQKLLVTFIIVIMLEKTLNRNLYKKKIVTIQYCF